MRNQAVPSGIDGDSPREFVFSKILETLPSRSVPPGIPGTVPGAGGSIDVAIVTGCQGRNWRF